MATIKVPANYYQHFDADFDLEIPAEGYGGWHKAEIEISREHTGIAVMHAWDCGTREEFPGWHRAVEYIPRADAICRDVFPSLLSAVREAGLPVLHVVRPGGDYNHLAGYRHAVELAGPEPTSLEKLESDPVLQELQQFRHRHVFHGEHNSADIQRGFDRLDFPPQARPHEGEGVAESSHQLFALCKEAGINHLIYAGFAIDGCLLLSPGGMAEMQKYGLMCSAFRQAVTAIENKETARTQTAKEIALWRVALMYGFVFDVGDFVAAISAPAPA